MESPDIKNLESRIDDLIDVCQRLKNENQSLKSDHGNLNERHLRLVEKTRIARTRVETMINRLKTLERS